MSDLTRGEYLAVACAYLRGLNSPCRTPEEGERAAALLETLEHELGRAVSALTRAATGLDSCRSQLSDATARASKLEELLAHDASDLECGCAECTLRTLRAGWRSGGKRIDELTTLVAQRDTELAAMETRVARAWEEGLRAVAAFAAETGQIVDVPNHAALPELLGRNPYRAAKET